MRTGYLILFDCILKWIKFDKDMKIEDNRFNSVVHTIVKDDGRFPNNGRLPLCLYKGVIKLTGKDGASLIEDTFHRNKWGRSWRNGIYSIHHYHSTAHEVLGVYSGTADVQFGGERGTSYQVQAGDVVVIPAGVAHNCQKASSDFQVVGAYPAGQIYDMCYGNEGERPRTDGNIARVSDPVTDPVYGSDGPLLLLWSK
jgi:uncharacterized protein YjlB